MSSLRIPSLVCLLAATYASARAAGTAPPPWKPPSTKSWVEVTSKHFVVDSSAGAERTKKIAVQLERFRMALSRISKGLTLNDKVPTTLLVFRNDEELTPYKLDEDGHVLNLSGYFQPGPFRNFVALDASAGSSPMRVVYHEYFHAVMKASLGDLPLWLNEGLAEYFSTFKTEDLGSVVQVGHPIEEHVELLRQQGMIDWEEVFSTTTHSRTYHERSRQGPFYAQSWLAVHYLNATEERTKALGKYLTLLRSGQDPGQALESALGMSRAAFAAAVTEYGKHGGSNYVWWDLGEEAAKAVVVVRDLSPAETLLRLGELQAHRAGHRESAGHLLAAAREAGAAVAPVETALGVAALLAAEKKEAEAHFRAAIAAGADAPEPYALLAELDLESMAKQGAPAKDPRLAEVRELSTKALARDPDCFPALVDLARTYVAESDTERGVVALEAARKMRPMEPDLVQLEACLLARGGKPDAAWRLAESSRATKDEARDRETRSCIVGGTLASMRDRLLANDVPGAKQILTAVVETIHDPEIVSQLSPYQQALAAGKLAVGGEQEEESTASAEPDRARSEAIRTSYNEAVDLANAHRTEEALAKLDLTLQDCKDESACAKVKSLADDLRKVVRHNGWVTRYNEGVDLYNNGKRKQALATFQALESEVDDPQLREAVQKMLASLGVKPQR